jgi:peptidyl-prolyl cis-trans isomerase SurA
VTTPAPRRILTPLAALAIAAMTAFVQPAAAQSLFAPVARVNDSVITAWEVDQRARFLDLFRTPGDTRQIAIDRLIEERLQRQAAEAAGLVPSPEAIEAGMTEFAGRVNLTVDEFIQAIGQGGVSGEAFRDFVVAGIAWRELVRQRFGP